MDPLHFQTGDFQIREPHPQFVKGERPLRGQRALRRVSPDEVDLWILPAVACDTMGHRLGRGGGYYDRLLASCVGRKGRTPKIVCLAFEFQMVNALPFEKTDRSVDMIITETRTIICGEE